MILHCKNAEMTMLLSFLHFYSVKSYTILHCKNAEMTITLSFLHFYSVKSYNFCYFLTFKFFFLNLEVFYIGGNKKVKNIFFFFFSKMQKFGLEDP